MKTYFKIPAIFVLAMSMYQISFAQPGSGGVIDAPKIVNRAWEKNESGDGHVANRKAIPYAHLRQADVMWAKRVWRQLDLREKMNLPLYYPENQIRDRISLTQTIWKSAIVEGTLRIYDDEDFETPLTAADVIAKTSKVDSTSVPDPDNPEVEKIVVSKTEFESKNVLKYWLKEDWFFDRQRSVLDVRVIGICPIMDEYTVDPNTGEKAYKGFKNLFWIYFPDLRPILAANEVYNRANDAERRSFDDIFHKRFFSSFIIKEENVYDRYISEYELGLYALIEGEKIKEDIFTIEQDLWEY